MPTTKTKKLSKKKAPPEKRAARPSRQQLRKKRDPLLCRRTRGSGRSLSSGGPLLDVSTHRPGAHTIGGMTGSMNDGPSHEPADQGVPLRHGPLPGTVTEVDVSYFTKGDRRLHRSGPKGKSVDQGTPIEDIRRRLGGNDGYVWGPTGEQHQISLRSDVASGTGVMVRIRFHVARSDRHRESDPA